MIKTITFKGRNEETGDWEVGALVAIDFRPALVLGSFERIDDCTFHLDAIRYVFVKKETLCVCTGVNDANGWDIYENDILSTPHGNAFVTYDNGSFIAVGVDDNPFSVRLDELCSMSDVRVIGNKHEEEKLFRTSKLTHHYISTFETKK